MTAMSGLHIHAGWAAFDAGLHECAMHHYTSALELASEVGDAYLQVRAVVCRSQ